MISTSPLLGFTAYVYYKGLIRIIHFVFHLYIYIYEFRKILFFPHHTVQATSPHSLNIPQSPLPKNPLHLSSSPDISTQVSRRTLVRHVSDHQLFHVDCKNNRICQGIHVHARCVARLHPHRTSPRSVLANPSSRTNNQPQSTVRPNNRHPRMPNARRRRS